jgi:hypothetical protein
MYAKTCNSSHVRESVSALPMAHADWIHAARAAVPSLQATPSPGVSHFLDGGAMPAPISEVLGRSTEAAAQRTPSFRWSSRAFRKPLAA